MLSPTVMPKRGAYPAITYPGLGQGDVLVHEFGHFFGLHHVFHVYDTCLDGDGFSDTPASLTPNYGPVCTPTRNTCASAGNDAINNYMDYSDDLCRFEFTRQQILHMQNQVEEYMPTKYRLGSR
jgi:hypothetical protein